MFANLNTIESLNKEQVKQVAPSVFTKHGSSNVSEKYSHIPTERVMDDMSAPWCYSDHLCNDQPRGRNHTRNYQFRRQCFNYLNN